MNRPTETRRPLLRVIEGGDDRAGGAIASGSESAPEAPTESELHMEANALEAWYGPNAYSFFLRKHGRRPGREQAATIGRLLGGRVAAADGSMQPPLTKADREVLRGIKSRRKAASPPSWSSHPRVGRNTPGLWFSGHGDLLCSPTISHLFSCPASKKID